jgi:hypothetical protein
MGRDGWIALGLLAFSGWLYSNLGMIPANPLVPIGPAFYPRLLLLLLIILSLGLVLQSVLAYKRAPQEEFAPRHWLKQYQPTFLSFFVFALYVLLLPKLGFLISTALFVATLQWLLGPRLWRRLPGSALLGVGTSLLAYAVFELYLRVLLPSGSWLQ